MDHEIFSTVILSLPLQKENLSVTCKRVLVNHLVGLSLPGKGVVRLIDHPDMTLAVYSGCLTTTEHHYGWM